MDVLVAAVGLLGCGNNDYDFSDNLCYRQFSIQLLAKIPLIIANFHRIRQSQSLIKPRKDLSIAEHFFYGCFACQRPGHEELF